MKYYNLKPLLLVLLFIQTTMHIIQDNRIHIKQTINQEWVKFKPILQTILIFLIRTNQLSSHIIQDYNQQNFNQQAAF